MRTKRPESIEPFLPVQLPFKTDPNHRYRAILVQQDTKVINLKKEEIISPGDIVIVDLEEKASDMTFNDLGRIYLIELDKKMYVGYIELERDHNNIYYRFHPDERWPAGLLIPTWNKSNPILGRVIGVCRKV